MSSSTELLEISLLFPSTPERRYVEHINLLCGDFDLFKGFLDSIVCPSYASDNLVYCMPKICCKSVWMCVTLSCHVNKLVTWLSSVKNAGCRKCKVTIGPINISCKDNYSSPKMTKGRVIVFKIQGVNLESWKTGRLARLLTFFTKILPNTLPGPVLGG